MTTFKLSDVVSPAFSQPHRAIKTGTHNELVLKGGRGSAKSSYASVEGVLRILENPKIHGVVMRKISNTLRTSVYAQYVWAVTSLGLYNKFKFTVAPMEIIYKATGQKIMFFGADDPGKLKSIKVPFGYNGYLHLEELDQFSGEDEVRNIEQSTLRGGSLAYKIKTFNPPKTKDNWANKYCLIEKPGQLIHHSTFLTTPVEWLGQPFIDDAEHLKAVNLTAFEHEYMGEPNGTGGNVFDNVTVRKITDEERAAFDRIYMGVDWGWYPDPYHWGKMHFDAARRKLYIFDEYRTVKTSNEKTWNYLFEHKGVTYNDLITADSAENKSVGDYRSYGSRCRGAIKGPGSVDYSMKWLQSLSEIIIDQYTCPKTAEEYLNYEYDRDKEGNVITGYPDRDNHAIDMTRYAMEQVWRRKGQ